MTIKNLIKDSKIATFEAELLLALILKKDRLFILTNPDFKINLKKQLLFFQLEKKRLKNWPMAYLVGQKGFYDLTLNVNKKVLIPRPETEIIVEKIIDHIKKENISTNKKHQQLIDIGTGSGAIIIALAKYFSHNKPELITYLNFFGLDISSSALKVAQQNIQKYHLKKVIKLLKSNLLNKLPNKYLANQNLVIAANLPYLTPLEIKRETSLLHEPKLALKAGHDGLKYYQQLLQKLSLIPFTSLYLIMEINPSQKINLIKIIKKYLPSANFKTIKDLRNKNRFIEVQQNK